MKSKYKIIGIILIFILGSLHYPDKPNNWSWKALNIKSAKPVNSNVKIAILDSGIRNKHINDKYIISKYDAIKNKNSITTNSHHGSQVASIIVYIKFNTTLIGLNSNISIYDCKVLNDDLGANIDDVIRGLEWSIQNNVDIINMSFGFSQYNKKLHNSIIKAHKKGIVLVASAGNNLAIYSDYPARFPEVISVSAIDKHFKPFKYSPVKK